MTEVDVTVVVCTYNRSLLLRSALHSLSRLETDDGFRYEVLVVDNASTDDTPAALEQAQAGFPVPLRWVKEERQGVSFARNRGVSEASGQWIAFFDDDQQADPDWLKELMALAQRRQARCVGGAVQPQLPSSCSPSVRSTYARLLGLSGQQAEESAYHPRNAPGAGNLMLHRSVFQQVGCFNTALLEAGEDSELFQRIYDAGIGGWYTPRAIVRHHIPDYRVSRQYLRWRNLRQGWSLARQHHEVHGSRGLVLRLLARAVHGYAGHLGLLLWGILRRQPGTTLLCQCRIWKTTGYVRGALFRLAPRVCQQRAFYSQLDFRAERSAFVQCQAGGSCHGTSGP